MITPAMVRRLASQAGISNDFALQEIVLTGVLQALHERGFLERVAFKGGTCLRKMHFGSDGRISTDLDFTARQPLPDYDANAAQDLILGMLECFQAAFHGLVFAAGVEEGVDWWQSAGTVNTTPRYTHPAGNGIVKIQVSIRETPTLPPVLLPQLAQVYFGALPFVPAPIACLQLPEIVAEKIRACFQRRKVRDIHDLFRLAAVGPVFDDDLVRRLTILKLWQVEDGFAFDAFAAGLTDPRDDWDDVRQLLGRRAALDRKAIVDRVLQRYGFLASFAAEEAELARDRWRQRRDLAEAARDWCLARLSTAMG